MTRISRAFAAIRGSGQSLSESNRHNQRGSLSCAIVVRYWSLGASARKLEREWQPIVISTYPFASKIDLAIQLQAKRQRSDAAYVDSESAENSPRFI
jgi:hypothetical protein